MNHGVVARRCVLAFALGLAALPARADEGLVLKFTLFYSEGLREFVTQMTVPASEAFRFQSEPEEAARKYLLVARKRLAEKQGYPASMYGADNWKMVNMQKWLFTLTDPSSGRVVAERKTLSTDDL